LLLLLFFLLSKMTKKLNVKLVVAGIVVGLACCIAVTAYFDFIVIAWVNNPYVASPARTAFNNQYGDALNAEMLVIGVFGAFLIKLAIPGRHIGDCLAASVFVSCLLFVVGNLEDWLYFIIGYFFFGQSFPAVNAQWSWMPQATWLAPFFNIFGFNGSWTTLNEACWSALWLLVVLPLALVAIFKLPKR
jgi:hypothetical protein